MAEDTLNAATAAAVEDEIEAGSRQSTYETVGERLGKYDVYMANAADPAVAPRLAAFGYDESKITAGRELVEAARAADAANAREYGEQYAATEKVEKEFVEASKPYMVSLGVARIAFRKDAEARKALVLKGTRSRSLPEWTRDAELFYRNAFATPPFLSRLAEFGRTRDILDAEYKEVKDVAAALAAQTKEMGEAVQSTKARDEKMAELDEWMLEFAGIARIALADSPDLQQKLAL
ncbi:MAG: hypothetical protein GF410_16915 [Chitinivibrionales bacterium]|nr:hypothetical protein [Chitinivibrionales bacterium]